MTDLERRALLGDKQAQEECTRREIVLACPCCGCAAALHTTDMFSTIYAVCQKCGLRTSGYHSPDTAIKFWNTRLAPPIGRCKDCKHAAKVSIKDETFLVCGTTGERVEKEDRCSDFEPRHPDAT